ncbi:MAG TPA: hypothetical protein VFS48_02440 [Solirubrobacterales bacterium]|nr:hypothetical protein [Solirubrobacterales bacterium]
MRPKLTYANVVASLALFVALGGTSYAVNELGKNSVKSANIGKEQVKGSDIAKNAVTSPKVKDFSLLANDFKPGQLPAGPTGEKGEKGATGPKGPQGAPGLTELERVYTSGVGNNSNSPKSTTATCAPGKVAISAGYDISGAKDPDVTPGGLANVIADVVIPSSPSSVPGSVFVEAWEEEATAATWGIDAIAICAKVAP